MKFAGFQGVVRRAEMVPVSNMSVVPGSFVIAGLIVLGCGIVMFRGVFVLVGCQPMMLGGFRICGHPDLLARGKK
jgi:hypothetical protein